MMLIPQRLFGTPSVTTILRNGNVCILKKQLGQAIHQREGYISNHVISMVLAGEQLIRPFEGSDIRVKAGEVLFIPRGMYYITDLVPQDGAFESLLFYFDDNLIQEFLATSKVKEISKQPIANHLKFGQVPTLQIFAQSLLQIYQSNQLQDTSFLTVKILELLYLLNGLVQEQHFADFLFRLMLPKKRNIKQFMATNYDKPLKIEDYAYLTGRSISTFRRDFKTAFDTTPQQWIKHQRLNKALTIVQQQEISVTDLAYEVGYENISYFIKAFKAKVGISPKQYMLNQHRNHL